MKRIHVHVLGGGDVKIENTGVQAKIQTSMNSK